MNTIVASFKQHRQIWAWAVVISLFMVLVGHVPAPPVIAGGLLAVVVSSLRALSYNQKKPWQREVRVQK
jgi:hypothetical protein